MRESLDDKFGWITGAIIALVLLGLVICSICLVGKLEQRETPKDTRTAQWAQHNKIKYNL
jgi:hypothetical protein